MFLDWCAIYSFHTCQCTKNSLAVYLLFLFRRGRGPDAIKGHGSAVGPVFRILGIFNSNDENFSNLVRSFQVERPRLRSVLPRWDVGLVLNSFREAPYLGQDGSDRTCDLNS